MGKLQDFYDPTINTPYDGSRPSHTTFSEIVYVTGNWSDHELEYTHNYIQWLFPIPEVSQHNARVPPLDRQTRDAFLTRQELRDRMLQAWKRMMAFYGWDVHDADESNDAEDVNDTESDEDMNDAESDESTTPSSTFDSASITPRDDFLLKAQDTWLMRDNHNHLRISRMIRSMRILGLYQQAQAMLNSLVQANNAAAFIVNPSTLVVWFDAAMRPTCYPPIYPRAPVCNWLRDVDYENGTEESEDGEEGASFECDGREVEYSPEYSRFF
ncbi:hypothetical protein LTR10_012177 [Elasticomyces elasticus]|nr:hypothetical protein LTR10_012177 [Elasticomyces elasticus]KAK4969118.1 hypothetical protein LTR42_009397 [Elasticomyces elasticus]